jgi:hypothetical protein
MYMDCHSSHWQRGVAIQLSLKVEMVTSTLSGRTHGPVKALFIGLVTVTDWSLVVYSAGVPARPRLPQNQSVVLARFQMAGVGLHHRIQKLESNMSAM